jgi:hypothetical protein
MTLLVSGTSATFLALFSFLKKGASGMVPQFLSQYFYSALLTASHQTQLLLITHEERRDSILKVQMQWDFLFVSKGSGLQEQDIYVYFLVVNFR